MAAQEHRRKQTSIVNACPRQSPPGLGQALRQTGGEVEKDERPAPEFEVRSRPLNFS
jgi:hypothetical protein